MKQVSTHRNTEEEIGVCLSPGQTLEQMFSKAENVGGGGKIWKFWNILKL